MRILSTSLVLGFRLTEQDVSALLHRYIQTGLATDDDTASDALSIALSELGVETQGFQGVEQMVGLMVYAGGQDGDLVAEVDAEAVRVLQTQPKNAWSRWDAMAGERIDLWLANERNEVREEAPLLSVLRDWVAEPEQATRVWSWHTAIHTDF